MIDEVCLIVQTHRMIEKGLRVNIKDGLALAKDRKIILKGKDPRAELDKEEVILEVLQEINTKANLEKDHDRSQNLKNLADALYLGIGLLHVLVHEAGLDIQKTNIRVDANPIHQKVDLAPMKLVGI